MQKQMWYRSKDVSNSKSFWKESFSCATEYNQIWFIYFWNRWTFAARPLHSYCLLYSSRADPCDSFTATTVDRSSALVLNLFSECQTLTSVQRCLQLTTRWDSADEQLLSLSVGPRCGLWQMRWKCLTLHEIEKASNSISLLFPSPEAYIHKLHCHQK